MTDPQQVAQVLSGRVPVKAWKGAWAVWDCPCGKEEERMTLVAPPTKVECFHCGRSYILYDPVQDND